MPMGGTTKWSRKRRRKEILLYNELDPLATLIEIGEQFGVTKQYISQFLRSNNIVQGTTKRRKDSRPIRYCKHCGKRTQMASYGVYYPVVCPECKFYHKKLLVHCAFCKTPFYREKNTIRYTRKNKEKMIYCSLSCYHKGEKDGLTKKRTKSEIYRNALYGNKQ